ncbi:hypothetical protein BIV57_00670 [Mangrovactinospora gilvigrisea]|uniref:AB hydrolase-1 domain-containing protein n=1 Tax=Mangrovactinospora gilvigrisea TaxID=1428644 RepID=A0A1J7BL63_9ACTN|nr:hypothetical protein BIV57_00670 [Mangrovactinospora gilvigrisea]
MSGDGPPLLLHPGIYQIGAHWSAAGYTPALASAFTVVEIDPLAHGSSAAPVDPDEYRLDRRAADVVAVLDDIGADRAVYWGYSMGGWVGCGLALHAPDRLAGLVVGGWDPAGGIEVAYAHARRTLALPDDVEWTTLLRESARRLPPQAAVINAGTEAAFDACHRSLEHSPDLSPALSRLAVPLMLYTGESDPYHGGAAAVAARTGAHFAGIPDRDHAGAWYPAFEVLPRVAPFLHTASVSMRQPIEPR